MQIKNAKFVTSFADVTKYLEYAVCRVPEICVVGRSNVGKSTFINTLASQGKLAKTSSTPGRTRLVNIFDFNDAYFRLVDLPGYGYALASKHERADWGELIEGYLLRSPNLAHTFVLVDSRHKPTKQDEEMVQYLYYYRMPFTVLATKCDKLSRAELNRSITEIAATLKMGKDNVIPIAVGGVGMPQVKARIESVIETYLNPPPVDEE